MYIPKLFKVDDTEKVKAFIENNGFGILVNQVNGRPWATHIPLVIETNSANELVLSGHISKGNTQWKAFQEDQELLVIFQGSHAYISSSWYDHENVPTWNYTVVHVYGKIRIVDNEIMYRQLSKLVDKYEAGNENPVSVSGMSADMIAREMRGIVGFEIVITEIQAAEKLSQNRDEKNFNNIISELEKKGDADSARVADAMKKLNH